MIEKFYWDGEKTKPRFIIHRNKKGEWHRVGGPAYQRWYDNDQKEVEVWFQEDWQHRLDGPAWRQWDPNGRNWITIWDIFGIEVGRD